MITTATESAEDIQQQIEEIEKIPPFASFDFEPEEVLTVYGSICAYVQLMVQKDQAEMVLRAAKLMVLFRPVAVRAAQTFPQGVTQ